MTGSDLEAERQHHQRVRDAMAAMRETATELLATYERQFAEGRSNRRPGDARPDHNMGFAMGMHSGNRIWELADRDLPLFFGRIWLETGEDYHLGRRHVRDELDRSTPLVVDWRAPMAGRFYRASPHNRLEVERRRRFGFRGSTLTSLEDEDLRAGAQFSSDLLTSEIERPRSGPMRDIVATIQPEQDELIRREADTTLCVQGAPGTGKTAVGLHRAAWLLYTYSGRLGNAGMLVVGPNDSFLRYISGVLPTLGETSVRQLTVDAITGANDTLPTDPAEVATLKHDARMAQVCRRAAWSHLQPVTAALEVTHGGLTLGLDAERVAALRERAASTARTYTAGRKSFEDALASELARDAENRTGRPRDRAWTSGAKKQAGFKATVDRTWPRLTGKQVLRRLYTDDAFRDEVCRGILTSDEASLLAGGKATRKVSTADAVLLDELDALLRSATPKDTYGHVVIDEAQDLSAMQCRAIARRCPTGALTVLGDLAQGTTPWAARTWSAQMGHLGRADVEFTSLTTGYRVPAAILALANRLLPHLRVSVPPARSLRTDGAAEIIHADDLPGAAAQSVEKALAEEGMVGVIATEDILQAVAGALPPSDRVDLVPAGLAKGLEYDHVVLVEPAAFLPTRGHEDERVTGLRHLYVALTRAVSRLTVVHGQALPEELGAP